MKVTALIAPYLQELLYASIYSKSDPEPYHY